MYVAVFFMDLGRLKERKKHGQSILLTGSLGFCVCIPRGSSKSLWTGDRENFGSHGEVKRSWISSGEVKRSCGELGRGETVGESLKSRPASTGWWSVSSTRLPPGMSTNCFTANCRKEDLFQPLLHSEALDHGSWSEYL